MTSQLAIDPALLYHRCDPQELAFETTAELPELTAALGQHIPALEQRLADGARKLVREDVRYLFRALADVQ